MAWLRRPAPKGSTHIVIKGRYASGKKMTNGQSPSKKDFLPKGILKELEKK